MKLPDFIIPGAMKCGTTFLRRALGAHPRITMARIPVEGRSEYEIKFFSDRWERGTDWYRSLFSGEVCGEKTASYLDDPLFIRRMYQTAPSAKLIVALRDPTTRLYSNYRHHIREIRDRGEVAAPELSTFESALQQPLGAKMFCGGLYWQRLQQVFQYYPRRQVHIVIAENMRQQTQHEMDRIYRFLGVEPIHPEQYESRSSGGAPMKPETEAFVRRVYRPHNKLLYDMLQIEAISAWR
jgi:hypothetical protein